LPTAISTASRRTLLARTGTLAAAVLCLAGTVAVGTSTAATAPRSTPTHSAPIDPDTAPYSGKPVVGAITGPAARTGYGAASQAFLRAHDQAAAATTTTTTTTASPSADATSTASTASTSTYEHQWWGIELSTDGTTMTGEQATHTADADLRMTNDEDYLYSPTTKPRYGSCIEVTTAYTSTYAEVWAWDWCASDTGIGTRVNITGSWLADYSPSTAGGVGSYTLRIVQTNASANTWTAYLFNYATDNWDTFYTSSGTDQATAEFGWDQFEYYSYLTTSGDTYLCSGYAGHSTGSSGIEIRDAQGGWSPASTSNTLGVYPYSSINGSTYYCPTLSSTDTPDNAWTVTDK
jgi:hypothetical protein